MAVQAQYYSSFNNTEEEVLLQQQHAVLLSRYYNYGDHSSFNGTCNNNNIVAMEGSRKRSRDDCLDSYDQQFRFPNKLMKAYSESGSQVTSTSGRVSQNDLSSHMYQQNQEMELLILLENQKHETRLKEVQKKQRKTLLSVIEQQVLQKMQDKEKELALARILNAELEEKLLQLNAENQIWFNVAKKNESMVSFLKSSLEQILHVQKQDSSDSSSVVDDAESCCDEDDDAEIFNTSFFLRKKKKKMTMLISQGGHARHANKMKFQCCYYHADMFVFAKIVTPTLIPVQFAIRLRTKVFKSLCHDVFKFNYSFFVFGMKN